MEAKALQTRMNAGQAMAFRKRPGVAAILSHGIGEHCFPFGGQKAFRPKYAHEVGRLEGGHAYLPKQRVVRARVTLPTRGRRSD